MAELCFNLILLTLAASMALGQGTSSNASSSSSTMSSTSSVITTARPSPVVVVGPPPDGKGAGYFHIHNFAVALIPHSTSNIHQFNVSSSDSIPESRFSTFCSNTTSNYATIAPVPEFSACEDHSVEFNFLPQGVAPATDYGNWNLTIRHTWSALYRASRFGKPVNITAVSIGHAYFPGIADVYDYPDPLLPWYEAQYMVVPQPFDIPYLDFIVS